MFVRSFMTALAAAAIVVTLPLGPGRLTGSASAEVVDSKVLYRRKAWEVSVIAFDDGTFSCVAEVGSDSSSFLVWADTTSNASLQFYNTAWSFNDEVADITVRIDSRASWTLNDSTLNQNSVFFTLPDEDASYRFLREIMQGNALNLYSSSGARIVSYSLAGSYASILKLSDCVDALKALGTGGNPFN